MSDIGILNGPFATTLLLLIFASPGLAVGAIAGALTWRHDRFWSAGLGAVVCCGIWLLGHGLFYRKSLTGRRLPFRLLISIYAVNPNHSDQVAKAWITADETFDACEAIGLGICRGRAFVRLPDR